MKKTLLFLLCFVFLLVACNGGTEESGEVSSTSSDESSESVSEASQTSQEESKKEWVEHETRGNAEITRQYLDGENDYIVTVEEYTNEVLRQKTVTHYINKQTAEREEYRYSTDGKLYESIKTTYGEEYDIREVNQGDALFDEIAKVKSRVDKEGNIIDGTIEHYSLDGEKLSEGTLSYGNFNGRKCIVSNLLVYGTDEKEPYFQICAYDRNMYNYYECTDKNGNTLFSHESKSDSTVYYIGGEYELTAEYVDDFKVFTDKNGKLVAELEDMTIITVGEGYEVESTVETLNEVLQLVEWYRSERLYVTW